MANFWCAHWVDHFLLVEVLLTFIKAIKIGLDRLFKSQLWDELTIGIIVARLTLFLNSPPPVERKQSTIIWLAGSGQSNKLSTQPKPEKTKYSKKYKIYISENRSLQDGFVSNFKAAKSVVNLLKHIMKSRHYVESLNIWKNIIHCFKKKIIFEKKKSFNITI